ncbi:MAG: hypothetical protein ACREVN_09730 [Gammaproteobacteria bacterium]
MRRELVQQRPALSVGAGLVAFGLAAQPVLAASFPAELELSSLLQANGGDGSAGFVLNGIDAIDVSGRSVSTAGDVNGDGIDDLIVGAPYAETGGRRGMGESYVVFGRNQTPFPAELALSSLLPKNGGDGSAGFVLDGIEAGDNSGISVNAAGDVNGDGIDDLIVGASRASPGDRGSTGQSYVVFGRDQTGFPTRFRLSSLLPANGGNGSAGFVLNGTDAYDGAGTSVSAAGDVNGDGIDDVLVSAPYGNPGGRENAGQSYVVFGRNQTGFPAVLELSSLLPANGADGSVGLVLNGIRSRDYSGLSASAAGDVNGDGIGDLLVGTFRLGARPDAGESYVVFGQAALPAELELSSLLPRNGGDGSAGFILNGIDDDDQSGFSVSAAGDVNADGIDDLLVGARSAGPGGRREAGESYVVFGRNQAPFPAKFELSSLLPENGGNGSAGFILNGIDEDDSVGSEVSAAGDVNGDGIDDLLLSAFQGSPGGRMYAGESYVVFGRDQTAFPAEFELSSLQQANGGDGSSGFILNGIDAYDFSGGSLSAAGDVNGDGIDDVLIGADSASPNNRDSAGESYVVFGRSADSNGPMCDGLPATVVGTPGDDVIRGTSAPDVIHGLGGDDTISGLGGNDTVCGGRGRNFIEGNAGHDRLFGGIDMDVIRGGSGNDELFGRRGNDVLFGHEGDDQLFGRRGIDLLIGGTGFDDCNGGKGIGDATLSCELSTNIP